MPDELAIMSINVDDGRQLAYLVASSMRLKVTDAQALLEMDSVRDKLLRLTGLLEKRVEVLELGRKIQSEAQGEMERMQREFFLREQMKAIQKELGEEDEHEADIRETGGAHQPSRRHERRGGERSAPRTGTACAHADPGRGVQRDQDLPGPAGEPAVAGEAHPTTWTSHARQVLDEDHYGLDEIKERILEFLAVRKLRAERKSDGRAGRMIPGRQDSPRARRA
jgi:ATP-dependent Lon protease